jgi:hypothetical protein
MKRLISLLVVAIIATTSLWAQKAAKHWQKLGEKDSLFITSLNINSVKDDYAPIFIDGVLYFTSSRRDKYTDEADLTYNENIYTTRYVDTAWSSTRKWYYFNNDDYTTIAGYSTSGSLFTYKTFCNGDFYSSQRGKKHWTVPKKMKTPINSDFHEQSITEANGVIVFSSNRPGGQGEHDIYCAQLQSNGTYTIVPLDMINSSGDEVDVSFSFDKKTLYFSSNGLGGKGGYDIFFTKLDESGHWSKPESLPINSMYNDRWFMNCDSMFFMTTDQSGNDDIFWGHILEKHSKDTIKKMIPKLISLQLDSIVPSLNGKPTTPIVFLGDKDDSLRNVKLIAIYDTLDKYKFKVYYAQVQIGAYYYLRSIEEFKYNYPAFDTTKIFVEKIKTEKGMLFKYLIDQKYSTLMESAVRQQQAVYQQTDQENRYQIKQGDAFIAVYDKDGQRIMIYINVYTRECKMIINGKKIYF